MASKESRVMAIFWLIMIITILIISIPLIATILSKFNGTGSNTEQTYWIFPLVIFSAILIIVGIFIRKTFLINLGFGLLFVFILLIELFIIFPAFIGVREKVISYEVCKEKPLLRLGTISCILTGYEPNSENFVDIISFWVFILILPFAVIYSITFGLFFGMGLDKMFGVYGRPVISILAFATALFGMRQFIGPFLIDLLAYGVWGIFGVLIACIITGALRFIMLKTFIETEEMKKSIASMFKLGEMKLLEKIRDFMREVDIALSSEDAYKKLSPQDIDNYISQLNIYKNNLEGIKKNTDDASEKAECEQLIKEIEKLIGRAKEVRSEIEKQRGGKLPQPPYY
ncbi:MAG: hypothetical protein QXT34_01580 [Candidatus Aenigmatarchaeota archaeon]